MLDLIRERLYHVSIESDYANQILTLVEDLGMVPPNVLSKELKPANYRFGAGCSLHCDCHQCNPNFILNKWESENNT